MSVSNAMPGLSSPFVQDVVQRIPPEHAWAGLLVLVSIIPFLPPILHGSPTLSEHVSPMGRRSHEVAGVTLREELQRVSIDDGGCRGPSLSLLLCLLCLLCLLSLLCLPRPAGAVPR